MLLGRNQFDWEKVKEYYDKLEEVLVKYEEFVVEEVLDFDHPWINRVIIKSTNDPRADDLHNEIWEIGYNFHHKFVDMHEPIIKYEGEN